MDDDYLISELPEEKSEKEDFEKLTPQECLDEIKKILKMCEKPKQEEIANGRNEISSR